MKVKFIKSESTPGSSSQQISEDVFKDFYTDEIIKPPYNPKELKRMKEYSTILGQCIEAYATNIAKFGLHVQYREDYNAASKELKQKMDEEWTQLQEFIRYLHFDESPEKILEWMITDREYIGIGYLEVLRDGTDLPCGIEYVDAETMRICRYDSDSLQSVPVEILRNGQPVEIKRNKRFRKFVQIVNNKKVYFKEFGDPRYLNKNTGEYSEDVPEDLRATEILQFKLGKGVYGMPRWIGNLISLLGARKAEELNFLYFKKGRHTPAAVIVNNGILSEESIKNLQRYMNDIEGVENAHGFLLLEAEGIDQGTPARQIEGEDLTNVKVEIKSLADMLQNDALFLEYDSKTRSKLRSAFRLPPLYTGESEDYTKATADTARTVTEEQVFQPERRDISSKLNAAFLQALKIHHVELVLKGPDLSNWSEIADALVPFINAGAVSPNDLRDLVGKILGRSLEEWEEEIFSKPLQFILKQIEQTEGEESSPPLDINNEETKEEVVKLLKQLVDTLEIAS
jgi:PBSX family phage portal protein